MTTLEKQVLHATIVSTDLGFDKKARSFAEKLDLPMAFILQFSVAPRLTDFLLPSYIPAWWQTVPVCRLPAPGCARVQTDYRTCARRLAGW